jgi:outer membrane protein assembly factor BamB
MTVIELGEVSSGPQAPPPAGPVNPRDVRRVLAVAVLLLTLLGVTGSARPEPRSLRTLWRAPASLGPFTVQGDTIYLQRYTREGRGSTLEARSLTDGRMLWKAPMAQPGGYVNAEAAGIVLVPTDAEQLADGSEEVRGVIALDAATGRERWRHEGEVYATLKDSIVLSEWSPRGGSVLRVHLIRSADGTDVWSYAPDSTDPTNTLSLAGGSPDAPTDLIMIDRSGTVQIRDLTDARLKRTAKVPWLTPQADADAYGHLLLIDGVLITLAVEAGTMRVAAQTLDTLRPLWSRFAEGSDLGGLFQCGDLICHGTERRSIEALDPRTGLTRWRIDGWSYGNQFDATRMFVESRSGTGNGVVDVRTGRVLATLPTGLVVTDPAGEGLLVLTFTEEQPVRMAVHDLRPDNTLRLAGALPQINDQGCQLAGRRLVCLYNTLVSEPGDTQLSPASTEQEIVVTAVG